MSTNIPLTATAEAIEVAKNMIIEGCVSSEADDIGLAEEARTWGDWMFQGHPKEEDLLLYLDWKGSLIQP